MGAQLDQILSYLDREGVTEVMVGMGAPAALRRRGQLHQITNTPVTRGQINILVGGTPLARLIPERDGATPPTDVQIGARTIRVLVSRRGENIVVRIERSPPGTIVAAPREELELELELDNPVVAPRSKQPSRSPETRKRGSTRTPETRKRGSTRTPETRTRGSTKAPPIALDLERPPAPANETPPARTRAKGATNAPVSRRLADLVQRARQRNASDLHIAAGRTISIRVLGELLPLDPSAGPSSPAEVESLLLPLLGATNEARLAESGYVDLALALAGGRLRTNISRAQGGLKGTFRIARSEPATLDELGLPKDLAKVVNHHQGLVVIAGPSGHGKTTTMSALVDLVNATRPHHIITVEDPIEIVYPRKAAVVSQREVGPHTRSFAAALKGSLREDPDVIVIGELRDRETVEIALTASETGHLVLATMSTPSAAKTIDRLVDMFPAEDQQQVRASIAGALRAIVSQRLLPRADGQGVVAAIELVTGVLPLATMIRDDKLYQLPSLLQRGKAFGMIRMDDSLIDLVRAQKITADVAVASSENKRELAATLKTGGPPAAKEPTQPQKPGRLASLFGGKKGIE